MSESEVSPPSPPSSSFLPGGFIILLFGVSGSGKTKIGRLLSFALSCEFFDSDDFHSEESKQKMSSGVPLEDSDRWQWLERLYSLLNHSSAPRLILACSALKRVYRKYLRGEITKQQLIQSSTSDQLANHHEEDNSSSSFSVPFFSFYLSGSFDLLSHRLSNRSDHFFPLSLLSSQLKTLEIPDVNEVNTVTLSIEPDEQTIVQLIQVYLLDYTTRVQ
jgi:gluconokinase